MACEELTVAGFSDDEIGVAAILLQLPRLILERELSSRVSFVWGSRRKRSGLAPQNDDARRNRAADASPPPPAPPQRAEEAKAKAPSPATPLSFSPSESDGQPKPPKRKSSHKRKREEWLRIIEELTERKELMKREIKNVSRYYDKLEAFNLELKAKKEELISQTINMVGEFELDQPNDDNNQVVDDQPLIFSDAIIQYNNNRVIVPSLPDLNAPVEIEEPLAMYSQLDLSAMTNRNITKIMASEARRKRIEIYRVKNSNRLR